MSDASALVPLPVPDEDSRPFWEGCRRGELLMQRCADCGHLRFTPRHLCPRCRSAACEWVPVSGRGTIYSRVVCHPPVLPAFADRVPYAVVLVELDEAAGLRLLGNLLGAPPEAARIGARVRVEFQELNDEIALPQWRLEEEPRSE
ncbi:MAG: OB-fold domain-containing protein [Myxococcota bacterium]|nr:OB-fold domain-containing protein [Myxococcota bacterium]